MASATIEKPAVSDLVRSYYTAFRTRDREAIEALLAHDFTFTSPYDDRIDRAAYFERCWPGAERIRAIRIEKAAKAAKDADEALVLYECELENGSRFRNMERLVFQDGKLRRVEVFFGDPPAGVSRERFREESSEDPHTAEESILKVLAAVAEAVRRKDVGAMLEHFSHDAVVFDMIPPLVHRGHEAIKQALSTTFETLEAPVEYEAREIETRLAGDVAFVHSLNRFGGTDTAGKRAVSWSRSTMGLEKRNGRWRVTHLHASVPFSMGDGKALLDLKP